MTSLVVLMYVVPPLRLMSYSIDNIVVSSLCPSVQACPDLLSHKLAVFQSSFQLSNCPTKI